MSEKISSIFPVGEENKAFAKYFIGKSYLNMLTTEGVGIGNVTFEPGMPQQLAYTSQGRTDSAGYLRKRLVSGVGQAGNRA